MLTVVLPEWAHFRRRDGARASRDHGRRRGGVPEQALATGPRAADRIRLHPDHPLHGAGYHRAGTDRGAGHTAGTPLRARRSRTSARDHRRKALTRRLRADLSARSDADRGHLRRLPPTSTISFGSSPTPPRPTDLRAVPIARWRTQSCAPTIGSHGTAFGRKLCRSGTKPL